MGPSLSSSRHRRLTVLGFLKNVYPLPHQKWWRKWVSVSWDEIMGPSLSSCRHLRLTVLGFLKNVYPLPHQKWLRTWVLGDEIMGASLSSCRHLSHAACRIHIQSLHAITKSTSKDLIPWHASFYSTFLKPWRKRVVKVLALYGAGRVIPVVSKLSVCLGSTF